ncbi:ribonuclease 3 [Deinococcus carri]|uniref:Ribonuclease 3 n=1 Tax=Deinococcus carri TaxID=1211323 RepID=A0ABP9WF60_9DEIO
MNAKGDLIARLTALGLSTPTFDAAAQGPAHEQVFHVTVSAGGRTLGRGEGRSKRDAERAAAEAALAGLDAQEEGQEDRPRESGGRWPIYAAVLEGALEAALDLAPEDATLDEVRADAARLYRDLLAELGHGPEPVGGEDG